MIYLTHMRLMRESERTVHERATCADEVPRRVCAQLLADETRYALWHARHENSMTTVAVVKRRERQLLALRSICVAQVHRTALLRYLRDYRIVGAARDQALRVFHGVMDARDAAIAEHRTYLVAASSHLCATELLELAGDIKGVELLRGYETVYGQYFSLFCDRSRAVERGATYLLSSLIPEVRANAERVRHRIVTGHLLPRQPVPFSSRRTSSRPSF